MSSLSLSGIEFLLRMTVALPVRAATLPIGSTGTGAAGEGASGAAAGGCGAPCRAGAAWTSVIEPESKTALRRSTCGGDGMALAAAGAAAIAPHISHAAMETCRFVIDLRPDP